jgi:thiamine pyrophosphokinase
MAQEDMHIIIFAGGPLQPGKAVDAAIRRADLVIAADSGAQTALQLGLTPAIVVGDFDSLSIPPETLKALGCQLIEVSAEKDETDTELAINTAIQQGASEITLLGGLGGQRFEHSIANILLIADYPLPIHIIDGPSVCWLLRGPGKATITGQRGDLLSLFPLTADAQGVCTSNLYYPLRGETLRFGRPRGISNVLTTTQAQVSVEQGLLLVIHTAKQELSE